MKRFFALLACLMFLFVSVSFADSSLSENEQKYVGAWSLYARGSEGRIYSFIITFLDSYQVVQSSLTFKNGTLLTNNKASGEWLGFTSDSIIFSLAGTDMCATIKDNGYLYLYFFKDMTLCGVYSRCEDMTIAMGW